MISHFFQDMEGDFVNLDLAKQWREVEKRAYHLLGYVKAMISTGLGCGEHTYQECCQLPKDLIFILVH